MSVKVERKQKVNNIAFQDLPEGKIVRWEGPQPYSHSVEDDLYIKLGGVLYAIADTPFLKISDSAGKGYYSILKDATVTITLEV